MTLLHVSRSDYFIPGCDGLIECLAAGATLWQSTLHVLAVLHSDVVILTTYTMPVVWYCTCILVWNHLRLHGKSRLKTPLTESFSKVFPGWTSVNFSEFQRFGQFDTALNETSLFILGEILTLSADVPWVHVKDCAFDLVDPIGLWTKGVRCNTFKQVQDQLAYIQGMVMWGKRCILTILPSTLRLCGLMGSENTAWNTHPWKTVNFLATNKSLVLTQWSTCHDGITCQQCGKRRRQNTYTWDTSTAVQFLSNGTWKETSTVRQQINAVWCLEWSPVQLI